MKALAKKIETGEVQEIDIIASIRGGIHRVIVDYPDTTGSWRDHTQTSWPIYKNGNQQKRTVYESPEDIDKDWEILSSPELYKNPTGDDYPELMRHYQELYAHVLGMYRDRILKDLI